MVGRSARTSSRRLPSGTVAPSGPTCTSPVFDQDTSTSGSSSSTAKAAGATGTLPLAVSSPSRALSCAGSVCTSVPSAVSPITFVTSARRPCGAPGAGALAMTSPTAVRRGDCEAEGEGEAEGLGERVSAPPSGEMTARRVPLSYELTLSFVRWACAPVAPGRAVAVAVSSGAAATARGRSVAVAAAASARGPVVAPKPGRDGGEEQPAARRRAVVAKAGMRARLSLLRVRKVSPGGGGRNTGTTGTGGVIVPTGR